MNDGSNRGGRAEKAGPSELRLSLDPADYRKLRVMAIENGVSGLKPFLERHLAELARGGKAT